MEETSAEDRRFSLVKRAKSFTHAGRGVWILLKSTHNAWIHVVILIAVASLGAYFRLSSQEWMMLIVASGLVLGAEAFNTAIEIDVDLTSPEYHPYARDTKDVAAGAVLICAITAFLIGVLVFYPHVVTLLR